MVVGKNLEPIWNEFLTNLNDTVVAITENEKATEGLMSTFQALGKVAGGVIWITKDLVLGVQNIASALSIPFENHEIQKNLEKVVKDSRVITKEWVAQNKAFMEQVDSQYDIDIQNSVSYTDELQAEYERRLKILNEFNKSYLSGVEKTVNEKLRLENLGDKKTEEFIPKLEIPKILKGVRENDYDVILNKIKALTRTSSIPSFAILLTIFPVTSLLTLPMTNKLYKIIKPPYRDWETDRKSTRLNSSHITRSRMPSSA